MMTLKILQSRSVIQKNTSLSSRASQSGLVLFVALVTLVVMSLAAVALIRSVDTNSQITGNLSYKQTASISSSYGLEAMTDDIGDNDIAYGNANDAANGYYATCRRFLVPNIDTTCAGADLLNDAIWVPGASSRLAAGVGVAGGVDAYGNTIQYIVERMCRSEGAPSAENCLLSTGDLNNSSKNVLNEPVAGAPEMLTELAIYRITVRVGGPKNTVSYIQAFIS